MYVAGIILQRQHRDDDSIRFDRLSSDPDRVQVTYRDGDSSVERDFVFHISRDSVSSYVSDVLFGLRHDTDPFDYIQVLTVTGPSILYTIPDLDDQDIRANIRTTIHAACNLHITAK